jgi:hypothetical protein
VKPWKSPLASTFAVSLVLLVAVGGWLLTDPNTSRSDALKTGGLAGGAVVALYALWLNDRRRRVEEDRQEIERRRHELEMRRTEQDRDRSPTSASRRPWSSSETTPTRCGWARCTR